MAKEDVMSKLRRLVLEETIKASKEYMLKEKIREEMQSLVASRVSSGEISNEEQLRDFWKTIDMAISALKMVPLAGYKKPSKE